MQIITIAAITFLGRGDLPRIVVPTNGTKEEHLRHAVSVANKKLEHPSEIRPDFRFDVREKDKKYAFVDDQVMIMTGRSRFECLIEITYALESDGNFFQLSKFNPIFD
ncbi:hypothetical protein [Gluconobacter kondonii]|uniref:hypothetical protein n=1 Tax=Gluconobacter kondonii TaxID=941463 RepID=UPI001B8BDD8D|nr:hypothetical protein [Gluconobacter kondonii]MBS1079116.1 hypothetical protein [Gluconobacter kondonii]